MKIKTRDLVIGSMLLALGVILPLLFHMASLSGIIFSPMHIPVLLAGFIVGPVIGLIVGVLTPVLNFLISSMPPIPTLWVMIIELAIYGFVAGTLYKKFKLHLAISLIGAMIVGRLFGALASYILASAFGLKLNGMMFLKTATLTSFPGIIIQLILIPILIVIYNKSFNKSHT